MMIPDRLFQLVSGHFRIHGYREEGPGYYFVVEPLEPGRLDEAFKEVYKEALEEGYATLLLNDNGLISLRFLPLKKGYRKLTPLVLSIVTLITVLITGYDLSVGFHSFLQELGASTAYTSAILKDAVLFTVFFMGSLLLHEMGHWTTARRMGVPVSLPYFLPAPPYRLGFIGTFGAVINMRSLPAAVDELAMLGLAGPLTGFIAGMATTVIGIHLSQWIDVDVAKAMIEKGEASTWGFAPLAFVLASSAMGPGGEKVMIMHPLAFAGFITLLVTFLNLLPIGQLDGGHVVRSVSSMETHRMIGIATVLAMFLATPLIPVLGFFAVIAWILFALSGGRHVGAMNTFSRPTAKSWIAVTLYLALLILTIPVPLGAS